MARARLNNQTVVDAALQVVDRDGFDALSISSLAADLGVGPSALYTYLQGIEDLQYLVAVAATRNLVTAVRHAAVGMAGAGALAAMGEAYRAFSLQHPGQFASTLLPPRSSDDELTEQNRELLELFITVFRMMGIADDEAYLAARSTRSALHGFLALEHNSGTTDNHGAEYQHLIQTLQRGLLHGVPSDRPQPPAAVVPTIGEHQPASP
jgi:AcrR family transcriptional regulator